MRCEAYRKPGQWQPLSARAAQLGIADPRGLPPVWAQCLEFDVARQQRVDRANAERLDAQLFAAIADPVLARKMAVPLPLDMQDDFGADLVRSVGFIDQARLRTIGAQAIDPPRFDCRRCQFL